MRRYCKRPFVLEVRQTTTKATRHHIFKALYWDPIRILPACVGVGRIVLMSLVRVSAADLSCISDVITRAANGAARSGMGCRSGKLTLLLFPPPSVV